MALFCLVMLVPGSLMIAVTAAAAMKGSDISKFLVSEPPGGFDYLRRELWR